MKKDIKEYIRVLNRVLAGELDDPDDYDWNYLLWLKYDLEDLKKSEERN